MQCYIWEHIHELFPINYVNINIWDQNISDSDIWEHIYDIVPIKCLYTNIWGLNIFKYDIWEHIK